MDKTSISNMPADQDTDLLVAEIVMGWKKPHKFYAPEYSTDDRSAWGVVDRLLELGFKVAIFCDSPTSFECRVRPKHKNQIVAHAETMALSVCRAALITMETAS